MSASIEYEENGHGVAITCRGEVNSDEVIALNSQIHGAERLVHLRYYILDLSEAESVDVSADKLRYLAEQLEFANELINDLKIAVVTNHEVVQSLVYMWCTYLDETNQQVKQFLTLEEARTWIDDVAMQRRA